MTIQSDVNFYKVVTNKEYKALPRPIAVFKRVTAFVWEDVGLDFDTVEDAKEFVKYADMLASDEAREISAQMEGN